MRSKSLMFLLATLFLLSSAFAAKRSNIHRRPSVIFKTLYTFTGGSDGGDPFRRMTLDDQGNLYGMVDGGGMYGNGGVYKLIYNNGSYSFVLLHSFNTAEGTPSFNELTLRGSTMYGATQYGGPNGCGNLFSMQNDGSRFTILYEFCSSDTDGAYPVGRLAIDHAGNVYGTTNLGGLYGFGTVFKYSGGALNKLIDFDGSDNGGYYPGAGVKWDQSGNLWGTNTFGGSGGDGTVFKLTRNGAGGWNLNTIHSFSGTDGEFPAHSRLAFFRDSNIFGTTDYGGKGNGVVYELQTRNNYKEVIVHNFTGQSDGAHPDGQVRAENGHLFGTTQNGGDQSCASGCGVVFELMRTSSGWQESVLHTFHSSHGCFPSSGVILDTKGNAFGTTMDCNDNGTVFEISGLQ
jgi:uncharacterized repeat protein (TIGR03803 family)